MHKLCIFENLVEVVGTVQKVDATIMYTVMLQSFKNIYILLFVKNIFCIKQPIKQSVTAEEFNLSLGMF